MPEFRDLDSRVNTRISDLRSFPVVDTGNSHLNSRMQISRDSASARAQEIEQLRRPSADILHRLELARQVREAIGPRPYHVLTPTAQSEPKPWMGYAPFGWITRPKSAISAPARLAHLREDDRPLKSASRESCRSSLLSPPSLIALEPHAVLPQRSVLQRLESIVGSESPTQFVTARTRIAPRDALHPTSWVALKGACLDDENTSTHNRRIDWLEQLDRQGAERAARGVPIPPADEVYTPQTESGHWPTRSSLGSVRPNAGSKAAQPELVRQDGVPLMAPLFSGVRLPPRLPRTRPVFHCAHHGNTYIAGDPSGSSGSSKSSTPRRQGGNPILPGRNYPPHFPRNRPMNRTGPLKQPSHVAPPPPPPPPPPSGGNGGSGDSSDLSDDEYDVEDETVSRRRSRRPERPMDRQYSDGLPLSYIPHERNQIAADPKQHWFGIIKEIVERTLKERMELNPGLKAMRLPQPKKYDGKDSIDEFIIAVCSRVGPGA
jgi:hypothetical protein